MNDCAHALSRIVDPHHTGSELAELGDGSRVSAVLELDKDRSAAGGIPQSLSRAADPCLELPDHVRVELGELSHGLGLGRGSEHQGQGCEGYGDERRAVTTDK